MLILQVKISNSSCAFHSNPNKQVKICIQSWFPQRTADKECWRAHTLSVLLIIGTAQFCCSSQPDLNILRAILRDSITHTTGGKVSCARFLATTDFALRVSSAASSADPYWGGLRGLIIKSFSRSAAGAAGSIYVFRKCEGLNEACLRLLHERAPFAPKKAASPVQWRVVLVHTFNDARLLLLPPPPPLYITHV